MLCADILTAVNKLEAGLNHLLVETLTPKGEPISSFKSVGGVNERFNRVSFSVSSLDQNLASAFSGSIQC